MARLEASSFPPVARKWADAAIMEPVLTRRRVVTGDSYVNLSFFIYEMISLASQVVRLAVGLICGAKIGVLERGQV